MYFAFGVWGVYFCIVITSGLNTPRKTLKLNTRENLYIPIRYFHGGSGHVPNAVLNSSS